MMTSYKLANYAILRHSAVKNKPLPYLLVSDRSLCSKDNEIKNDNIKAEDHSTKEKGEEEEPVKAEGSSPKDAVSEDPDISAAKQKLKSLLSSIKIAADKPVKKVSALNLAKPLKRISKKERMKQMEAERITPEKKMDMAVKAVASSFKEDSEKVETELASKVSSLGLSQSALVEEDTEMENSEINNEMNEKLMSSVEEVADTISESPIPPRSELAKRLMRLSLDQKLKSEKKSMKSVIEGMTIQPQKTVPTPKSSIEASKQIKRSEDVTKIGRVNLFGATPLKIFSPDADTKPESTNVLWKKLEERELRLLTQFAPANAFEEMIMWTEQGKHWKFPIDNQTEMKEEEKYGFHEHVFLEHHLEGFPTKGPIRHFMELVVVGLSKNPYITVERKLDHIEWFRTYFKEKEELLREEGAIDVTQSIN